MDAGGIGTEVREVIENFLSADDESVRFRARDKRAIGAEATVEKGFFEGGKPALLGCMNDFAPGEGDDWEGVAFAEVEIGFPKGGGFLGELVEASVKFDVGGSAGVLAIGGELALEEC